MSEKQELISRMTKFLIGCIGIRILFVVAAKKMNPNTLQYFGILAVILAVSFVLINRFGLRKTGREAGGIIWWDNIRPIHAIMYSAFAILAFTKNEHAWVPLLLDVLIGLGVFLNHHDNNGDFAKVFDN